MTHSESGLWTRRKGGRGGQEREDAPHLSWRSTSSLSRRSSRRSVQYNSSPSQPSSAANRNYGRFASLKPACQDLCLSAMTPTNTKTTHCTRANAQDQDRKIRPRDQDQDLTSSTGRSWDRVLGGGEGATFFLKHFVQY